MTYYCVPDIASVVAGSQNVFSDGIPIARQGDPTCTSISEGSDSVFANGLPVARIGDSNTIHCTPMQMASGSEKVFANAIGVCRVGDINTPHLKPNWTAILGSLLPTDFSTSLVNSVNSLGIPGANYLASGLAGNLGLTVPAGGWPTPTELSYTSGS